MNIKCCECGKETEKVKHRGNKCLDCYCQYQKEYRRKNDDRLRAHYRARHHENRKNPLWVEKERKRGREYWAKLRHEIIMAYGGYECACCGESEPMFLSIDHIDNNGARHRRALGYKENGKGAHSRMLIELKREGFPPGYQVLCMNCNHGKARNGGVCPHVNKTP